MSHGLRGMFERNQGPHGIRGLLLKLADERDRIHRERWDRRAPLPNRLPKEGRPDYGEGRE